MKVFRKVLFSSSFVLIIFIMSSAVVLGSTGGPEIEPTSFKLEKKC